jgi:hypothetical protein
MEENKTASSQWKELLQDDKNFDQNIPYDYDKVVNFFENIVSDLDHINPYYFIGAIYEFTKAFKALSSALSMGFADITEKCSTWRELFKNYYSDEVYSDMQSVMLKEIELNFHVLNGENNAKYGQKKGSPFYTYVSGSRTLVRLSWFLEFLYAILKNMLDSEDPFSSCIKKAYQTVLAPHHPWLIRTSIGVAMNLAGQKRSPALQAFFGKEDFDLEVQAKMIKLTSLMYVTFTYINKWLGDRKLLDLE